MYPLAVLPMDDAALELRTPEAARGDRIFATPELIKAGFGPEVRAHETPAGPVGVRGHDDGRPMILELPRRRVESDASSRFRRYVERVDADVQGSLAVPSPTERAEQLVQKFGLASRQVPIAGIRRRRDRSLTEFVADETEER